MVAVILSNFGGEIFYRQFCAAVLCVVIQAQGGAIHELMPFIGIGEYGLM